MKKIILALVAIVMLVSCERYNAAVEKVEKEELKGQWRVITVNCPEVLAEKDGKKKVFQYESPYNRYNMSLLTKIRICQRTVSPGWVIYATSNRDYSFFPPPTK
ncbi:hypothetical protein EPN15_01520 [Patescibacteria group bacterium]|nr:MAG: hypothetical protein EPN15_01520 [Patescibacteria group bacterium]